MGACFFESAWRSSSPFSWQLDERKPVVFPFSDERKPLATRRTETFGIYYAQAAIECQFVFRRRARSIRVFVPSGCFAQDSYRRGPDFFFVYPVVSGFSLQTERKTSHLAW